MANRELVDIFNSIADMLEIEGVKWEPQAYRKAALSILTLPEDVEEYYKRGNLMDIEGVGKTIASHIEEYIKTGKIKKYEELKKKYPIDFVSLGSVRGLGPKKIYALYKAIGVKTIDDLKKAVEEHKIREIPGFSEKSEENIANNLGMTGKKETNRVLLGQILDQAELFVNKLRRSGVFERVEIAGSIRRMKETIGDMDILTISKDPQKAMDYFTKLDDVKEVLVSGPTKTSVSLKLGLNCDLRVIEPNSFGSAMQYFTGNKDHNIKLRKIAISKGLKLNEYGLFMGDKSVASRTEEEIYKKLGLEYMPPEMREDTGEIEAAQAHSLPKILEYREVLSDLHIHPKGGGGSNTIEEIAEAARKLNLKFIALTPYGPANRILGGMTDDQIIDLFEQIDEFNSKNKDLRIVKGVEVEIQKDSSFDLERSTLKKADFVLGAYHRKTPDIAGAVIKAIQSGLISSVAHPTGRILLKDEGSGIDTDKLFEVCEKNGVYL
ncbi:MAG: helix-hairpin-helix domain-containing protein, partial [Nanoarchaeota archaeon]|nr:helix-hairpin-helix domain-containing protein [Nanoarchaeota archaeon]